MVIRTSPLVSTLMTALLGLHVACGGGGAEKPVATSKLGSVQVVAGHEASFTATHLISTRDGRLVFNGVWTSGATAGARFLGSVSDSGFSADADALATTVGLPTSVLAARSGGGVWAGWEEVSGTGTKGGETVARGLAQLDGAGRVVSQVRLEARGDLGPSPDQGFTERAFAAPDGALIVPSIHTSEAGSQTLFVETFRANYAISAVAVDKAILRGESEPTPLAIGVHTFLGDTLFLAGRDRTLYILPPAALEGDRDSLRMLTLPEGAKAMAAGPSGTVEVITDRYNLLTLESDGSVRRTVPVLPSLNPALPKVAGLFTNAQGTWIVTGDRLVLVTPGGTQTPYPLERTFGWSTLVMGPGGDLFGTHEAQPGRMEVVRISLTR